MTYEEFINDILNTRGRNGCGDEYYEEHHIVPKCIGGTNDKDNLIDLFAKEHFEAHKLLALENPENKKLTHAWWMMSTITIGSDKRRVEITKEEYEDARKALSEAMRGENNPMYGKPSPMRGTHLTDEQKKHLREINLGEKSPMYGKTVSEETRSKMSAAKLGKKASNEAKLNMRNAHIGKQIGAEHPLSKPIAQYDLDGNFIKTYSCVSEAAREYEVDPTSIRNVLDKENRASAGYQWIRFNGEIIYKISPYINQIGKYQIKTIARCDDDWNIIDIWNGCKAAFIGTGINSSHISSCCNGKRKTAGGYKWKILDENYEQGSTTN